LSSIASALAMLLGKLRRGYPSQAAVCSRQFNFDQFGQLVPICD
jgi:hypothetical protein